MRLVWVVIPLILIGIIGVEESFATPPVVPKFWLEPPEIVFSNLPKVGETAEVTVIFNHNHRGSDIESADDPLHELEIVISGDTLEFVDSTYDTKEDRYNFGNLIVFDVMEYNESEKIMQVTIKSIAEGESRIGARVIDAQAAILFYTESEQAMLLNDYYEMYPEYLIEKTKTEEMEREKQRKAGLIPEAEPNEHIPKLQIPASFVDPSKNPQIYVDRYNTDLDYKDWFDENFSNYKSIYYAIGLSQTTIIPSPRQQMNDGILSPEIICKEGLQLIFKSNNSPACVKSSTAEKLLKRGWEIIKTFEVTSIVNEESTKIIDEKPLLLEPILEKYGIEWEQYNNVDYSKTIVTDANFRDVRIMTGIPVAYYTSLEFPEFVKIGDEFDVIVKWTFTEYDEEGNIEHQNIPLNNLTKEIFDETLLQVKIPENIEIVTDVSDWEKTVNLYYDASYNFNNTLTTYVKTIPFDYTDAMHEQIYRFKLIKPFFPPFDYMTLTGLGFGKTIHHQDGSLFSPQLDIVSINTMQSAITVERLGSVDPQYPEVLPSEVNWKRASEIIPEGINTPADPDENQTQEIRDFYVNILNRNPTNDELLSAGVSQEWIDSFFEKYPELKNKS